METKPAHRKLLVILLLVSVGMFGFGFALVPIYNVLCKATGLNGKTGGRVVYNGGPIDESRLVTVQFVANTYANLNWDFRPKITSIKLHPGEIKRVDFYAKNNTDETMTVQAIPSVTPGLAASHLKKTECFCFTRQIFKSKEEQNMPLLFHVDTALPKDITMLTLSYTLFEIRRTS
jgi:cytochrome c oxidase assembly protein subunit 11